MSRSLEDFWDRSSEAEWIIATVLDKENWQGRICARKSNDDRMDLQLSSFVVKNHDKAGEPICIVFSFVDITELNTLRRRLDSDTSFIGLVGLDPKILEIYDFIRQAAWVNSPVLIQGEHGTGKELAARAIHKNGRMSQKSFTCIDCRKTDEVERLFAGTAFGEAEGGTLFLKEVAALDKVVQKRLLDMLQERGREQAADIRIISSTTNNLASEVSEGNFLDELFYQLCVIPVHVPPLRERRNDIGMLSDYLLREALETSEQKNVTISGETIEALRDYHWPGNVRELKEAIQYAILQAESDLIMPRHLPEQIQQTMLANA
ncbi:MAG: sigma 54-interacting transcriptional regulator [Phycisphaerae bacterium]|nr:sigma 54-interacting transcriptional regulator [Phycisphaerae bacterium]